MKYAYFITVIDGVLPGNVHYKPSLDTFQPSHLTRVRL